jgi:hypothetical protein
MPALSATTPQPRNVHFAFTAVDFTEKRQILIVSSPRPQRKPSIHSFAFFNRRFMFHFHER